MAKNKNMIDQEETGAELNVGSDIGVVDASAQMATADLSNDAPTLVPGKNWKTGVTVGGRYLETTRVYSEKFTAGKKDAITGKKYRDLHMLVDAKGNEFGIWSVGILGNFFARLPQNALVAIKYLGLGDAPIKAGQSAPHEFDFQVEKGVRLSNRAIADDASTLPPPPVAPGVQAGASYAN